MVIEERSKHSAIFSKKRDLCDLRVLKGPEPNLYIIILKLSSVEAAQAFAKEFHKERFNRMEPDVCEVFSLNSLSFHAEQPSA